MERRIVPLWSPAIGAHGSVAVYGHWGRPVLAFPAEGGTATDLESRGMVHAVADLIDAGRMKLYCVESHDFQSWSMYDAPLEERARRHGAFESWILDQVVPFVREDCGGRTDILTTGPSLGAFHAANLTLKRGDLFPQALCLSGNYDPRQWRGWGETGEAIYYNTPVEYLRNMQGDHLDWVRSTVFLQLVCGQGMWEDTTGALESTRTLAGLLAEKGIDHDVDLWGHDVAHDWPYWRRQWAHHLPRFC